MPIFRRKNCIHTASGIVALCKRLHSTPVESRMQERNKARQNNTRNEIKGQRKTERKKEEKGPNQSYLSQLPPLIECGLQ